MASRRYVLRYRGAGPKPAADVESARRMAGITVVDESAAKMLLVECDEAMAPPLAEALPDWVIAPERTFDVPDARRRPH